MKNINVLMAAMPLWLQAYLRTMMVTSGLFGLATLLFIAFGQELSLEAVICFTFSLVVTAWMTYIGHANGPLVSLLGILLKEAGCLIMVVLVIFVSLGAVILTQFDQHILEQIWAVPYVFAGMCIIFNVGTQEGLQDEAIQSGPFPTEKMIESISAFSTVSVLVNWLAIYTLVAMLW